MGDIADMMLDGTLDCETGEYLGDAVGYPRTANPNSHLNKEPKKKLKKTKCKICGKMLHPDGIRQHNQAKHNKGV